MYTTGVRLPLVRFMVVVVSVEMRRNDEGE